MIQRLQNECRTCFGEYIVKTSNDVNSKLRVKPKLSNLLYTLHSTPLECASKDE